MVLEQRFLSLDRVGAKVLGARRSYVGTWLEQKCWVRGGLVLGRGWNKSVECAEVLCWDGVGAKVLGTQRSCVEIEIEQKRRVSCRRNRNVENNRPLEKE